MKNCRRNRKTVYHREPYASQPCMGGRAPGYQSTHSSALDRKESYKVRGLKPDCRTTGMGPKELVSTIARDHPGPCCMNTFTYVPHAHWQCKWARSHRQPPEPCPPICMAQPGDPRLNPYTLSHPTNVAQGGIHLGAHWRVPLHTQLHCQRGSSLLPTWEHPKLSLRHQPGWPCYGSYTGYLLPRPWELQNQGTPISQSLSLQPVKTTRSTQSTQGTIRTQVQSFKMERGSSSN